MPRCPFWRLWARTCQHVIANNKKIRPSAPTSDDAATAPSPARPPPPPVLTNPRSCKKGRVFEWAAKVSAVSIPCKFVRPARYIPHPCTHIYKNIYIYDMVYIHAIIQSVGGGGSERFRYRYTKVDLEYVAISRSCHRVASLNSALSFSLSFVMGRTADLTEHCYC